MKEREEEGEACLLPVVKGLFVCLLDCLFTCSKGFVCLFVCLIVCLPVVKGLFVCLFACLIVCLLDCLFTCSGGCQRCPIWLHFSDRLRVEGPVLLMSWQLQLDVPIREHTHYLTDTSQGL